MHRVNNDFKGRLWITYVLSNIFLLQLVTSFLAGGILVALATTLAERMGTKKGAMLLNVPTTAVVALFFMGVVNSAEFVQEAIPFSIVSLAIYLIFSFAFIGFLGRYGRKALFLALGIWLVLAMGSIVFLRLDLLAALAGFGLVYIAVNLYFSKRKMPKANVKPVVTRRIFIQRILLAGGAVALAVLLSKLFGASWGGIFSQLPASTSSAYWILASSYKKEFARAVAVKMLPFSLGFIVYVLGVYSLYPVIGIYTGTLVAFGVTLGAIYGLGRIFH